MITVIYIIAPVQNNQLGTGFGFWGMLVGIICTVSSLGELLAPRISARDIWAHIQIVWPKYSGITPLIQ